MVNKKPDYVEIVAAYLRSHPNALDRTQQKILKYCGLSHYKFTKAVSKLEGAGRVKVEKLFNARVYNLIR